MKPTTEQVLAWARDAGYTKVDPTKNPIEILERFATLAYAAGAAAMKERAAKVCDELAYSWRGAESLIIECAAAIRALGDDDD